MVPKPMTEPAIDYRRMLFGSGPEFNEDGWRLRTDEEMAKVYPPQYPPFGNGGNFGWQLWQKSDS